jgi:hypothetical protein
MGDAPNKKRKAGAHQRGESLRGWWIWCRCGGSQWWRTACGGQRQPRVLLQLEEMLGSERTSTNRMENKHGQSSPWRENGGDIFVQFGEVRARR